MPQQDPPNPNFEVLPDAEQLAAAGYTDRVLGWAGELRVLFPDGPTRAEVGVLCDRFGFTDVEQRALRALLDSPYEPDVPTPTLAEEPDSLEDWLPWLASMSDLTFETLDLTTCEFFYCELVDRPVWEAPGWPPWNTDSALRGLALFRDSYSSEVYERLVSRVTALTMKYDARFKGGDDV